MNLQERAERLAERIFLGGPVPHFERLGRLQLMVLIREGLNPDSKVLDIGCGCLRAGYWLIHFLDPGCYCGIEPCREMVEEGAAHILEPGLADLKRPRFDYNEDFDASVFGERFDFFLARSVWTHAAKPQIERMLDAFAEHGAEDAVFLASYLPAGRFRNRDYRGTGWVGKCHSSSDSGYVYHSFDWVRRAAERRGLTASELKDFIHNHQIWIRIRKG